MSIWKRFRRFFSMLASFFIEGLEDSVPLERRLAYDRQEKAGKFRKMMDAATDVGEAAVYMVEALAGARIVKANVRDETLGYLQAAKAAQAKGDKAAEEDALAAAAALADDLGEAEAEVAELIAMVDEGLRDKEVAKQLLLRQARELEKLARKDARLVARVRISEMKEQTLELKEAMLNLVPEDANNMRTRAIEMSKRKKARVDARSEIVDALWQQKKRGEIARDMQTTARGAQILRGLQSEVGYAPASAPTSIEEVKTEEVAKEAIAE
jgi:hypothetical protein